MKTKNIDVNETNLTFYNIIKNDLNLPDEAVTVFEDKMSLETQKEQNTFKSELKEEFYKLSLKIDSSKAETLKEIQKVSDEVHKVKDDSSKELQAVLAFLSKENQTIRTEIFNAREASSKENKDLRDDYVKQMMINNRWYFGIILALTLTMIGLYLK